MTRIPIALAAVLVLAVAVAVAADSASARVRLSEVRSEMHEEFTEVNDPILRAFVGGRPLLYGREHGCHVVGPDTRPQPFAGYDCSDGFLTSATRAVRFATYPHWNTKYDSTGWGHATVQPLPGAQGNTVLAWGCGVAAPERAREPAVALDGDIVAVAGSGSCEPDATIRLYDASTFPPQASEPQAPMATVRAPSGVTALALAGRLLAYATSGGVGVVDRESGRPLHAATLPGGLRPGALALRGDGTLAAVVSGSDASGVCTGRSVWVFSAGGSRKLVDGACDGGIALAGDSVIVNRVGADGLVELDRVALDGRIVTLAALRIDPRAVDDPSLDATWNTRRGARAISFVDTLGLVTDGRSVAFVQPDGCTGTAHVYVQSIDEAAPPGDRTVPRCPPRLGPIGVGRGRGGGPARELNPAFEPCDGLARCATTSFHTTIACASACEGYAFWSWEPLGRPRRWQKPDGLDEVLRFELAAGRRLRIRIADQECHRPGMRLKLVAITAPGVKRTVRRTVRCRRA